LRSVSRIGDRPSDRGDHVVEDLVIPRGIAGECMIDRLDAVVGRFRKDPKRRLPRDESVLERGECSLALPVNLEANRSKLHRRDWVMAIPPLRCGGQSNQVPRADLR
jgi:hypothetical protein